MTAEDLLQHLPIEKQMEILRSAYIQALMKEQDLNSAEACVELIKVAGSSNPSPMSGPVHGYRHGATNE
jgi:hypothetical protein